MEDTKPSPTYKCSKCEDFKAPEDFHRFMGSDRKRNVTSQCKDCRSISYFEKRYPKQVCFQCSKNRKLDKNHICGTCNAESGLRQCKRCLHMLPLYLQFYGNRKVCRTCYKNARKPTS